MVSMAMTVTTKDTTALSDAELAEMADLFAAEIEAPAELADWRRVQALLGIDEESVRGLGIAPPLPDTAEEPVVLTVYEAMEGSIDADRVAEIAGPEESE